MPIYEYKCENCGHEFEEMLHFSERNNPLITPCPFPTCAGKVHLKMSLGSFQLSGRGWAKDGYGLKKESAKPEDIRPPKVTTKYDD
jgi:putative FmdB family regulatory protein